MLLTEKIKNVGDRFDEFRRKRPKTFSAGRGALVTVGLISAETIVKSNVSSEASLTPFIASGIYRGGVLVGSAIALMRDVVKSGEQVSAVNYVSNYAGSMATNLGAAYYLGCLNNIMF